MAKGRKLKKEKRRNQSIEKLDLHGVQHIYVRDMVIRKIEDVWNTNTDVVFITGMSTRMKKIVSDVLKEYKLSYNIGDGFNFGFIRTTV